MLIINNIPIRTASVGVNHLISTHPDSAVAIRVAYADVTKMTPASSSSTALFNSSAYCKLGGIPLSVTSFFDSSPLLNYEKEDSVEKRPCKQYYALDVIVIDTTPDTTDEDSPFIKPSNASFGLSGSRAATIEVSKRYYLNVVEDISDPRPFEKTVIGGIQMLIFNNGSLVLNKTSYTMSDVAYKQEYQDVNDVKTLVTTGTLDLVKVTLGGLPLTAARIGSKYYLVVNNIPFESAIPLPITNLYTALTEGDFYNFSLHNSLLDGDFKSELIS
jgi:hypothetical protein